MEEKKFESIIDFLNAKSSFLHGEGVTEEAIREAENQLVTVFSKEFKLYLKTYGIVAFDGRELTGLSKAKRTNVVDVTEANRDRFELIPKDAYVVEETNFEGAVVWQKPDGEIICSFPDNSVHHLADSLQEYLDR